MKKHDIDLALLPINGRAPERRVAGNLDGREAAELAHAVGALLVVPCRYDMFTFNTASPDLFVETCAKLNQPHRVLRAGERLSLHDPCRERACSAPPLDGAASRPRASPGPTGESA